MKKSIKILSILLLALTLVTISTTCFAGDKIINGVTIEVKDPADTTKLATKAGTIVATIRNVAAIAAVVIIAVLGVKYMLGSVEEKAEYKKSFMPLIIGIVVVLLATQIAAMIFGLAK